MEIVLKEKHDIRKSNMTLEDKMNYDAVVRLCSPINRKKLRKENVQDSNATCF
jgi:hypothetical protein